MKVYQKIGYVCLFILSSCALNIDEEAENGDENTDTTSLLSWSGETDKFTINPQIGVHLDDPEEKEGTAYVTFPSSSLLNTRWEFGVRLNFNPSINNYARFYLTSSSTVLSNALEGYYIQIGGVKDNVALYRQNGNQSKLLISGRELMKGDSSPKFFVKVECDNNGYWTLQTRSESEVEYIKEGQIKDANIQESICSGIFCVYTKSRSDGFTFHHIRLSNDVEVITEAEFPEHPTEQGDSFITQLPEDVKDMLMFNEIMYNISTSGSEYIEIYNPTTQTITLPTLYLYKMYENGKVYSTTALQYENASPPLSIPSKGYLCFVKSLSETIKKHKVGKDCLIEIYNFPALSNDGGYLALSSSKVPEKGHTFDTCCFRNSMHNSSVSGNKGISLEKKSPELSSLVANWHSSEDITGGTPGIKNSGTDNIP